MRQQSRVYISAFTLDLAARRAASRTDESLKRANNKLVIRITLRYVHTVISPCLGCESSVLRRSFRNPNSLSPLSLSLSVSFPSIFFSALFTYLSHIPFPTYVTLLDIIRPAHLRCDSQWRNIVLLALSSLLLLFL